MLWVSMLSWGRSNSLGDVDPFIACAMPLLPFPSLTSGRLSSHPRPHMGWRQHLRAGLGT